MLHWLAPADWVSNDHHGIAHQLVTNAVAAAQYGADNLLSTGGQVLHGLMDFRIKAVAFGAKGFQFLGAEHRFEFIGDGLQRAIFQVTCCRPAPVIQDGQELESTWALARSTAT